MDSISVELLDQFNRSNIPAIRLPTLAKFKDDLYASARGLGANTRIYIRDNNILGYASWVRGAGGEFFGSPLVAVEKVSADSLINYLLQEAKGSDWIRISAFADENNKIQSLKEFGFKCLFNFIDLEISTSSVTDFETIEGISCEPLTNIGAKDFASLSTKSFAGVDNTLPTSEIDAQESLGSPDLEPSLSWVWKNERGEWIAFSYGNRSGELDSIGVIPEYRGRGIAKSIYRMALKAASRSGYNRITALVSSRNVASLRLHNALGFKEYLRRSVWEKIIT